MSRTSIHRVYVRCYSVGIQLTLCNQVKNPLSAVANPAAGANATEYGPPATTTMEICPVPKVRLAYALSILLAN